jgi:hypothetical protein
MPSLEFNKPTWVSDTQGSLPGMVFFVQSQVMPAKVRIDDDYQPHMTGFRDTLVLFKANASDLIAGKAVLLNAYAADGSKLNTSAIAMAHPNDIPKTPKFANNVDLNAVRFDLNPTNPIVISSQTDLDKLSAQDASFLKGKLNTNNAVKIVLADGAWTKTINLPNGNFDGKSILVTSTAGYTSTVTYAMPNGIPNQAVISKGTSTAFTYAAGSGWLTQADLDHSRYVYGKDFWSAKLPKEWIKPGLKLEFVQGTKSSTLNFAANGVAGLAIGAPTELLLHVIDLGMLTTPRDQFEFAKDDAAHAEYFQTIPASRFIVSRYESLELDTVYMPDGRVFTKLSPEPDNGGVYDGAMRQSIAKLLVSHGIDNANYGISSSSSDKESGHPYWAAQLTAHNSRGLYKNGVQVHGYSGGAGMVTLNGSIGNEFSHEVGHNYGVGHYSESRGARGAIHRPSTDVNSTWAWDSRRNVFIPNFVAKPTYQSTNPLQSFEETCDYRGPVFGCVEPFQVGTSNGTTTAFSFGRDAMGDGSPNSVPYWTAVNRFTIYTPYSAWQIQNFLEKKVVFDKTSSTGFRKWNAATYTMDKVVIRAPYWTVGTADTANQLNPQGGFTAYLQGLFTSGADVVHVAMSDGRWVASATAPSASANPGKYLTIVQNANKSTDWTIDGNLVNFATSKQSSYLSNGGSWNLLPEVVDGTAVRKPELFGVPVTTLLGYYDPQNASPTPTQMGWPGYIYPALHGAYGFVYPSESASRNNKGCWLEVTLRNSTRRYKLLNTRIDSTLMNKFQVNVPESEGATGAEVICNGFTLASKDNLSAANNPLTFTVNGMPLPK